MQIKIFEENKRTYNEAFEKGGFQNNLEYTDPEITSTTGRDNTVNRNSSNKSGDHSKVEENNNNYSNRKCKNRNRKVIGFITQPHTHTHTL